ncbi:MAG TPA: RNA polymerase sigma factor SigJ [Glaciibacter sp.]|nr:RNA polymerase sigma factor SigJ [Glaciibacter sp.]
MDDVDQLAEWFQSHRLRLRGLAYRMLGSLSEADDAVQEAWLRVSRAGTEGVDNLDGWLTTVIARVCLNMLRTRTTRREQPLGVHMPDPVVSRMGQFDPEQEALLSESVGLALLVVLDSLNPAERVAFVLHDIFGLPFDEVAAVVATTPAAARQLASRARRRVRQAAPPPDVDLARQRDVVDAFFAASRNGDLAALVDILHPDVVLRADGGRARPSASLVIRGGINLAGQAVIFAEGAPLAHPAVVNGAAGVVVTRHGRPLSVMGFIVTNGRIASIDVLADPERLARLGLADWPTDALPA